MHQIIVRASRALATLVLAAAATTFAGCGGSQGTICPQIVLPGPELVYPVNGATNVPDGNFSLVVAWGNPSPDFLSDATLYSLSSTVNLQLGAAPNPVPTPALSPLPPAASMLGANVPALAPNTSYNFQVTTNEPGACGGVRRSTIGSFTTI